MTQFKNPVDLVCDALIDDLTTASHSAESLAHLKVMDESLGERQLALVYSHQARVLDATIKRVRRLGTDAKFRVGREGWLSAGGLYIPRGEKLTTDEQLTNFGFLPAFVVDRPA